MAIYNKKVTVKRKYVTAFPGKRDGYELVKALYKSDRLAKFITGIYGLKIFHGYGKMHGRCHADLPESFVAVNFIAELLVKTGIFLGFSSVKLYVLFDRYFSFLASKKAKRVKASLLLYEFYAEYAFNQEYSHDLRKVVYYFHPHPKLDHEIHFGDCERYPEFTDTCINKTRVELPDMYKYHTYDAWTKADHILCSSSFTKRSLMYAGADEKKISVVPYGLNVDNFISFDNYLPTNKPYFLYVGSGIHRKGLHHLIEAWESAELAEDSKLIIVARTVDPIIEKWLSRSSKGVIWKKGVSHEALVDLYIHASAFVLPSLCEGFGMVYLEALSYGCPVVGTRNTCLPDLDDGSGAITIVEAGNVDDIANTLRELWGRNLQTNIALRKKAQNLATKYSWERYHSDISRILNELD